MKPALDPRDRRRRDLRRWRVAIVMVVALALYAALALPLRHSITDDTYIHLVYAKHFRDGQGLVFNPGQGVYGTTSPLWSLGLGVLGKTGIDLLALAHWLALFFGAMTILATALFLRRFMESWVTSQGYGSGRAELAWSLAVIAFAADAWLVRWSATGMETSLAAFLVTAGFAGYVGRRPWGNRVLVPAAWWAVASLVRPEASLLILLLLARILLSSSLRSVKLVRAGWALLPVAIVHGPWLLYALAVYHSVVPATLAAKTAGGFGIGMFFHGLAREVVELSASRAVEVVALVALAPLLLSRFWVRRADHFVPILWLLGLPLLYALRGVPAISRYLVPLVPVLLAYTWSTFAWLAASERRRPRVAVFWLVIVGVLSFAPGLYTYKRHIVPHALTFRRGVEVELAGLARWCRDNTPPGTEFAIPDIGAFGYFADRQVVDLAGLVSPEITPLLRRLSERARAQRMDDAYDILVTNLYFEGVARPPYLIDRAKVPYRMLFQSPYATVLTPIMVKRVDYRGIMHPEPAYYTLYKIDWIAFDRMAGAERQAGIEVPKLFAGGEAFSEFRLEASPRPKSISIRLGNDRGMLLDTARGSYTVDLVSDPDTTIAMSWTAAQLDTMRRAAILYRVMELPSPHPLMESMSGGIQPSTVVFLDIELDGRTKSFSWDTGTFQGVAHDPGELKRLGGFLRALSKMVESHPAKRVAPKPKSFYL